jgi:hypothetical protein
MTSTDHIRKEGRTNDKISPKTDKKLLACSEANYRKLGGRIVIDSIPNPDNQKAAQCFCQLCVP